MLPDGDQMNECVDLTASNREEWLELRMEGLGGSDSWTAMGLNPWKSRMALWAERCRPIEPNGLSQNEAVRLGTLLEQVVADEYARATGRKIFEPGRFRILRSAKHPWMFARLDREIPACWRSRRPGRSSGSSRGDDTTNRRRRRPRCPVARKWQRADTAGGIDPAKLLERNGTPGRVRTCDLRFRRPTL